MLFLAVDNFEDGLTDSLKGWAVNLLDVVVDSVPGGREPFHLVGIGADDVNTWDSGLAVNRYMVVGDTSTNRVVEVFGIAYALSSRPYLVDDARSEVHRQLFFAEHGVLAAYHVE